MLNRQLKHLEKDKGRGSIWQKVAFFECRKDAIGIYLLGS